MGWTIPVVPELEDITVGGAIMGSGVETSSHKFGLFQHTCLTYDVVLSDGSLVKCSKDEYPDLFYSIPWSYGTLGFLVAVEIPIIPAGRFVRVEYHPCHTQEQLVETFTHQIKVEDNDFVEGLVYKKSSGVIMTGQMTNTADPLKLNEIGKWHKPWFFKHVERYLKKDHGVEYFPIRDYYHRHSRSFFWMMQDIVPFGNHWLFRLLLGWTMPPKVSLLKLTQTEAITRVYDRHMYLTDMLLPLSQLQQTMDMAHNTIRIYPQWLCAFKLPKVPGFIHPTGDRDEMFVDYGLYGRPNVPGYDCKKNGREMESYLRSIRGFQMLYPDCYMTREEFRQMFDHSLYDTVRRQFHCDKAFPEVYEKICKKARR
jgi:delta24-sterol reductase